MIWPATPPCSQSPRSRVRQAGTHLESDMPHRSLVLLRLAVACVALTSLPSSTLHAQALRLTVTEEGSARPVAGGVADVLDGAGNVVVQGILGADGRRVLALPAGRGYRVRIRRIGFEPFSTAAPSFQRAESVALTLDAPGATCHAEHHHRAGTAALCPRCLRDPGVSSLWTEIRTALAATALSRADSTLSLESRSLSTSLDPRSRGRQDEQVGLAAAQPVGGKPYVRADGRRASRGRIRAPRRARKRRTTRRTRRYCSERPLRRGALLSAAPAARELTEGLLGLRFRAGLPDAT